MKHIPSLLPLLPLPFLYSLPLQLLRPLTPSPFLSPSGYIALVEEDFEWVTTNLVRNIRLNFPAMSYQLSSLRCHLVCCTTGCLVLLSFFLPIYEALCDDRDVLSHLSLHFVLTTTNLLFLYLFLYLIILPPSPASHQFLSSVFSSFPSYLSFSLFLTLSPSLSLPLSLSLVYLHTHFYFFPVAHI